MQMEELRSKFNGLVDQYSQRREYIRRAQAQAHKFSPAVVQKVLLDHEVQSSAIADQILPHVPALENLIRGILAEESSILAGKAASEETFQELELRLAIGELDEAGFDTASADLKAELEAANAKLEGLAGDRASLEAALSRWVDLAASAGQDDGTSPAPAAAPVEEAPLPPAPAPEPPPTSGEAQDSFAPFDDEPVVEEPVIADDHGQYASVAPFTEDVSAVFSDEVASEPASEQYIEVGDGASLEEALQADAPADVEDDFGDAGDEIGIDLDVGEEQPEATAAQAEGERRALLLYQEGNPDEQIYPFTGEVLTIGRSKDNDIQIPNDSKVSRFHCKLFRRGNNFYVEDNKSSNGTLVNGELITERRLFGGEEVIIGETFFRFRVL